MGGDKQLEKIEKDIRGTSQIDVVLFIKDMSFEELKEKLMSIEEIKEAWLSRWISRG